MKFQRERDPDFKTRSGRNCQSILVTGAHWVNSAVNGCSLDVTNGLLTCLFPVMSWKIEADNISVFLAINKSLLISLWTWSSFYDWPFKSYSPYLIFHCKPLLALRNSALQANCMSSALLPSNLYQTDLLFCHVSQLNFRTAFPKAHPQIIPEDGHTGKLRLLAINQSTPTVVVPEIPRTSDQWFQPLPLTPTGTVDPT